MELNTIIVTQARMGSTRLPGKIMLEVEGKSLLEIHITRLKKCKGADAILIATTLSDNDDLVVEMANKLDVLSFRGSENDVLDRFYKATKPFNPEWVVRVTSDCPLIDSELVDQVISFAKDNSFDYCSNVLVENFPDGQDVEVFKFKSLEYAWENATLDSEREHVTPFLRNNIIGKGLSIFKAQNFDSDNDYSKIRLTVDEVLDFELVKSVVNSLGIDKGWREYVKYIINNNLGSLNGDIVRNEGYLKSLKNDKNK
jgi:spore coat polysaccharide biosynthesis protein SpsF